MKRVRLIPLISLFFLLFLELIHAEVKLPAIVSSNMVLQHNTTVVLWGWADANEAITIHTSWLPTSVVVNADQDGNWRVEVKTTNSKDPQSINLKSDQSNILLDNILFGEVWLCSGQSNMFMLLKKYKDQPIYEAILAEANNPNLRLFSVDKAGSKTPLSRLKKYKAWEKASSTNIANFSAVAYFYGKNLQEKLKVPVGIIHSSYGASSVQSWMSKEVLTKHHQDVSIDSKLYDTKPQKTPTSSFNAMINPIIPYTIKGALWYQGENNRKEPKLYRRLFPAMVESWRSLWEIGYFPFYYVQIAPFKYAGNNDVFQQVANSAFIREAQLKSLDEIPNSGIAITLDIGNELNIHPVKKIEVADRLLRLALHNTYGYKDVDCLSPTFSSLSECNNGLLLEFTGAESGFSDTPLENFEIAGENRVFYSAIAVVKNKNKVFVNSDKVPNPKAVRYGWRNWVKGSLLDKNLLPASSFRTDKWEDATRNEK